MKKETLAALYDAQRPEFMDALRSIMQIKSVRGPSRPDAPFGSGPRAALDAAAELGTAYGFQTKVINGAMTAIQWGDDDQHYIGIVGHLDVVPAGEVAWHFPPYDLTEQNGRLYGRGILDNKGPSMACLFGMKLLKEAGYRPTKTIRLILGSDEESGSADVPRYLASQAPPDFGFTPDCKFPVVYGERGIVNYQLTTPITDGSLANIGEIRGDQASDHVPDQLEVMVNGQLIRVTGKRAPSNAPELGDNAITRLADTLLNQPAVHGQFADYCRWLVTKLADQHNGVGLGMAFADAASGNLIVTPYQWQKAGQTLTLRLAIRYPVTYHEADVMQALAAAVLPRTAIEVIRSLPGVLHDRQDPRLQDLSQAYEQITGQPGQLVTTTGATYARAMPNIVAFGPSFPGQKGIAHNADEWMDEQDLKLNMLIDMTAMMKLGGMTD
ncbi:Sapep family Mn(2+)-dependent dipeptidase [Lacticaseibacillus casei]|uniref:Sapep family Mn(2+)-dependent dipeptidase n=1 Tax=Lacticaseibacillus huelsenbergensis TaxID=3035291 RepID=A0ABY8DV92_9LACO|nr:MULTISPECIES: Sapep family Mn(2+)-dependent dipeptidase [Lacticaseibacillus]MDG3062534.1 Sapep family Mn(2+)-dependent dipeptidase [Lacticaseibacillus sp. BCRC 81376]QVI36627.1 Sapep family Mn(2+)-dependent dipeptidase [Lacticaseibacillus casei]QXG58420.1 Sapep family Mn(2+)-dependent dipeptidase [Lacticaseibacillus casei]WFB40113.1 Sapep family Mn(2+)-dependent dipeptidase [Lacticaseibacillus huelsenbergensis]WFB41845.1 Sapep family Mn(2+)-dependent dipeptidase [Lacticaseibacillus huelsenb